MEAFDSVTGVIAAMPAANVDTDVIMPKQFLKGVDRQGLDRGLFFDLRFDAAGGERPEFMLNRSPWRRPSFLAVGPNFGCGSSREHAVWGLRQLGIRALVGTTFAGIFFDNCARNGLLAVSVSPENLAALLEVAGDPVRCMISVNLRDELIYADGRPGMAFDVDRNMKYLLLNGLDAIDLTMKSKEGISRFEEMYFAANPWLAA